MNIATSSPFLVLLFVGVLLWILMNVRWLDLTKAQKWLVSILIPLLGIANHILRLQLGSAVYGKLIFLTMHLPFFLLFLYLTRCGVIKMTFMILSAVVFMAPTVLIGNAVKSLFTNSFWVLLLANLLTYVAVLLLAQLVFRRSFNYIIKHADNRFLLRFCLVPFLYYIYLFAAMNIDFSSLNSAGGYIARLLPTIYVFVFYLLLLRNYKDLDERRKLELAQATLHQQLTAAAEQVSLLSNAQSNVAVLQHNMRHHLTAIDAFLSADNPQQARLYIHKVQNDVESIIPKRFCENELVNLLCSSFSHKAEQKNIRLTVDATLPQELSISDTELCSILSNGLENALHAACELEEFLRWTELFCGIHAGKLLIEIKNPYQGEITMQDGLPTSNREGHGYGCRSIRSIAEQNRGICMFEAEHNLFTLRVALPLAKSSNP